MFMNVQPRIVSNGFETFVPARRTEPVHQRLVEMTNNKVNAGGNFWSVATSVSDSWDCSLDGFSGNENSPLNAQNLANLQIGTPYYSQTPVFSYEKVPELSAVSHSQHQNQVKHFAVQQTCDEPNPNMNCYAEQNPMLGNGSSWSYRHRNNSFTDFTDARNATNFVNYQRLSSGSGLNIHASSSSMAPAQPSYQNTSRRSPQLRLEPRSNLASQVNCTSNTTSFNPSSLSYSTMPTESTSTKDAWYSETADISHVQYQDYCRLDQIHDGLPRGRMLGEPSQSGQVYGDMWNMNYAVDSTWASQPHSTNSETISPDALTLNFPSVPLSSSGSSNDHMLSLSDLSTSTSSEDDERSIPEKLTVEMPVPVHLRQNIPDSVPISRRIVPVLASNAHTIAETSSKTRPLNAKSETHRRTKATSAYTDGDRSPSISQPPQVKPTSKRIEPKAVELCSLQSAYMAPQTTNAIYQRDAKDTFLVQSKLAGMSYKDIRKQGGFTEAESTLRGRFRTLTKVKSARVRKPEWSNNDVRLLKKAVRKLTTASDYAQSRVPWKQVAEYIANNGGSYHFGNATCRKKWDELNKDADE